MDDKDQIKVLIEDNKKLRKAGTELAEASLRVIREYDGTHRLALAVSKWSKTLADEGGRNKLHPLDNHLL